MTTQQAASAAAFIDSIGINTHIDAYTGPYGNFGAVESALNYLGIGNVRDSPANPNDTSIWQQVSQATGVKFDAYIGDVSPSDYRNELSTMQQLAGEGLLNAVEGVNEPDASCPASLGASLGFAAAYQQNVWQLGQQLGLPVINTSFGNVLDYGLTGDLSAWTDYGNAHTYFGTGNNPAWAGWIETLNAAAQSSASSRPVMITESGYYTTGSVSDPNAVDETVQAKYMLDLVFDTWQAGNARTYINELLDQNTGDGMPEDNFGLFHSDGSPKLAATAIHDLVTLLNDPGGTGYSPGSLDYSLSGMQGSDQSLLLQKSDGTSWLAVWNDTRLSGPFDSTETYVPSHQVILTLGSTASSIQVFDPLTGTSAVQSASNTNTLTFDLPDHPILIEVGGSSSATPAPSDPAAQIVANDPQPVITADNTTISATVGDQMIFIAGTGDTLTATGGAESVQGYQGGNTVITGAADDTIRFAGSANTIDAGVGNNHLEDSGSANTIVLPTAGQGYDDIFGWVMQNGDTFDLRSALAQTGWNGDPSTLGQFVQVSMTGNDAVISIDPAGTSGVNGSAVAMLHDSGAADLSTLLARAMT